MPFKRELVVRELIRLRGSIALLARNWRKPRNWVFARMVGFGRFLTAPPYKSVLLREVEKGFVVVDPLDRVWLLAGYVKNVRRTKRKISVSSLLFVREDQGPACVETVKIALGPFFVRVRAAETAKTVSVASSHSSS